MIRHRRLTSTICAFRLGLRLRRRSVRWTQETGQAGFKRHRCPHPRRPVRSRPAPGAGSPGRWSRWPPTHGRIRTMIRSPFAGPRFWHGGVMLRRAEFWPCSNESPFGNASQSDGPGPGPREVVIDPPCRAGEVPGPTPDHPFQSPGLDLRRLVHDPRRIADRDPSLIHRQAAPPERRDCLQTAPWRRESLFSRSPAAARPLPPE